MAYFHPTGGGRNFCRMAEISVKNQNFDIFLKSDPPSLGLHGSIWSYEILKFFLKIRHFSTFFVYFPLRSANTQRMTKKRFFSKKFSKFHSSRLSHVTQVMVGQILEKYQNFDFWQKFLPSGRNFYHLPVGWKYAIFWFFFDFQAEISDRNFNFFQHTSDQSPTSHKVEPHPPLPRILSLSKDGRNFWEKVDFSKMHFKISKTASEA